MGLKKQFLKSRPVCKVTFTLPKDAIKNAKEIKIVGDFNDWDWEKGTPMKLKDDGYAAIIELEKGHQYEFRYQLDNQGWVNDWEADGYHATPYGVDNSVVYTFEK